MPFEWMQHSWPGPREQAFAETESLLARAVRLRVVENADSLRLVTVLLERVIRDWRTGGDTSQIAEAILLLGDTYLERQLNDSAITVLASVADRFARLGDAAGESRAWHKLSVGRWSLRDPVGATAALERSVAAAARTQQVSIEGHAANELGYVLTIRGVVDSAQLRVERAMQLSRRWGHPTQRALTFINAARIYQRKALPERELAVMREMAEVTRQAGDTVYLAAALNNLGRVLSDLGRRREAIDHFERALALLEIRNDQRGRGRILANIAQLVAAENVDSALVLYGAAIQIQKAINDPIGQLAAEVNLGKLYLDRRRDPPRAVEHLNEALKLSNPEADPRSYSIIAADLGRAHLQSGNVSQALERFREAARWSLAASDPRSQAVAMLLLGRAHRALGQLDSARAGAGPVAGRIPSRC